MQARLGFYIGILISLWNTLDTLDILDTHDIPDTLEGIQCYTCSMNVTGEPENTCEKTTPTSNLLNCKNNEYCQAIFTIQDGITTDIKRSCQDPLTDVNANSNLMPTNDICEIVLDVAGNPTALTTCFYSCNKNKCNNQTSSEVHKCDSDCNVSSGGGICNFITGKCDCNVGYSGSDCWAPQSAVKILCYQCTTNVDEGNGTCSDLTQSTEPCPGDEPYCAATKTQIYDSELNVIHAVVTRGCTRQLIAADECAYTNIYTDSLSDDSLVTYKEFTCYSTCDFDGCNRNDPDGGSETVALFCVQCDDPNGRGDCNNVTIASNCPSAARYCKTTVNYLLTEKTDLHYKSENPAYRLAGMKRECAIDYVSPECKLIAVDGKLTHYACVETCGADGCNTGWPARPKCIQCATDGTGGTYDDDGYDECLENPPLATDCEYPYQGYCYVYNEGMIEEKQTSLHGYPRRITRGCSYNDRGTGCSTRTILGKQVQNCNHSCNWDGCNYGNGGNRPLWSIFSVAMSAAISWRWM